MATIISAFEGPSSRNKIEVGGKAISLAIVKTTTDWATKLVSQKSSFFCIPRTSPVNTRRSKATSFSKTSFPCKNLQSPPFIREGETIYKKLGKIIKRSSCVEHSSWISNFFHRTPLSTSLPVGGKITTVEKELTEEEISQMLEKGAIIKLDPSSDQFLSSIFTVSKKDGGDRPVVDSKKLNSLIHCPHLKMEGLFLVRELLSPNDRMLKRIWRMLTSLDLSIGIHWRTCVSNGKVLSISSFGSVSGYSKPHWCLRNC